MITAAQRTAVAAADLPFDLSDADVALQWNGDGSRRDYKSRFPMQRARQLAVAAMDAVIAATPAAAA